MLKNYFGLLLGIYFFDRQNVPFDRIFPDCAVLKAHTKQNRQKNWKIKIEKKKTKKKKIENYEEIAVCLCVHLNAVVLFHYFILFIFCDCKIEFY